VTQEELERLKENGQADEFVEYSDEVVEGPESRSGLVSPAPSSPPSSPPPQQMQAEESVQENAQVQLQSEPSNSIIPSPPEVPQEQYAEEYVPSNTNTFSPSDPPPQQAFQPPPPPQNFQAPPSFQQQQEQEKQDFQNYQQYINAPAPLPSFQPLPAEAYHHPPPPQPQPPQQTFSQLEPKIKPSQPLDYDDLITGPPVDVTRPVPDGPRDIIVKSSFSHGGGGSSQKSPKSAEKMGSGWKAAVEEVPLEDSIKFMLPGGGTKATGSIQWGGFQPMN
jgi:hypothetical protein